MTPVGPAVPESRFDHDTTEESGEDMDEVEDGEAVEGDEPTPGSHAQTRSPTPVSGVQRHPAASSTRSAERD